LSGGERSRVALAKLTLQGANFLVLDEPTNHLDLPARQMLEEILAEYDGTLIFVSHDRYFVDALATKLWVLEDAVITAHVGNYTTYRTRKQQAEFAAQAQATRVAVVEKRAMQERAAERASAPLRTVERLEAEIAALETRVKEIEAALAEASGRADVTRITELGGEYEEARARLEQLYEEWQELAS
jgi:ATP-binding cassette, subfamily F, member 3